MNQAELAPGGHIGIAGGGLLGCLTAWQLLQRGYQVTLHEAGHWQAPNSAAHTAAGMIAPVAEAIDTDTDMYDWGMQSLALWPTWLAQLNTCTPKVHFSQQGSLIVAHPKDHALLQQYQQDMRHKLPATAQGQKLQADQLHHLEPDLASGFTQALLFPQEAHLDNRSLLHTLYQYLQQHGRCTMHSRVDVSPYRLHLKDGSSLKVDHVIDCRGVGAKTQWPQVRGVRGEVLRVCTTEVHLNRPVRLLHPRYQLYIVPQPKHEFVIGATQIESEDTSNVSVQSALELNSALYTINPAFAEARIISMQANLRPALDDNRPHLQHQNGLTRINGLYRHGYLLAPALVQQALQHLCPQTTETC